MNNPTESKPHQQHVYDSSLKALFQDQTQEMLSLFAGDVTFIESLDGEAIKLATLRTDRCFRVTHQQGSKTVSEVVHVELQTGTDSEIVSRMLEYFGILYRKFQVTIRPVVVYLFYAELPEPQLIKNRASGDPCVDAWGRTRTSPFLLPFLLPFHTVSVRM